MVALVLNRYGGALCAPLKQAWHINFFNCMLSMLIRLRFHIKLILSLPGNSE